MPLRWPGRRGSSASRYAEKGALHPGVGSCPCRQAGRYGTCARQLTTAISRSAAELHQRSPIIHVIDHQAYSQLIRVSAGPGLREHRPVARTPPRRYRRRKFDQTRSCSWILGATRAESTERQGEYVLNPFHPSRQPMTGAVCPTRQSVFRGEPSTLLPFTAVLVASTSS